jgi:hypothetical protein
MGDMVERVARAIHKVAGYTDWDKLPDDNSAYGIGKIERLAEARAAIEAMREPTEAMVAAADRVRPDFDGCDMAYWYGGDADPTGWAGVFGEMIDAALGEQDENGKA